MPQPRSRQKLTKRQRFLQFIKPDSPRKKMLMFVALFAIIGGGYLAYRSFALTPVLVGADGEFTPITPARVLDTRNGTGGYSAQLGPNQTYTIQITGRGGVPASDVKAVVMNVTVTQPSAASFLTIYPSGESKPGVSNINFVAGQTKANQTTVKLGADGKLQLYNASGYVHIMFDVSGYYASANGSRGGRFNSISPTRIFDTRSGAGGYKNAIGAGQTASLQVTGQGGVLPVNATAIAVNITVTQPTAASFLTVYPSGGTKPETSVINFVAGQTTANFATVKVGTDGKVLIYNPTGSVQVIIDIVGYYALPMPGYERTQAGRFVALSPQRMYDSRDSGSTLQQNISQAVACSQYKCDVRNAIYQDASNGSPTLVLNATATNATTQSFVTIWGTGFSGYNQPQIPKPATSNLNFKKGETTSNQVYVTVNNDSHNWEIGGFNNSGTVDLILDVAGYFADDPNVVSSSAILGSSTPSSAGATKLDFSFTPIYSGKTSFMNNYGSIGPYLFNATNVPSSTNFDLNASRISYNCLAIKDCVPLIKPSDTLTINNPDPTQDQKTYIFNYPLLSGTTYKVQYIITKDPPNRSSGYWMRISIGSQGVLTPIIDIPIMQYPGATIGFMGNVWVWYVHNYGSCTQPNQLSLTFGDIHLNDQPVPQIDNALTSSNAAFFDGLDPIENSTFCPGIARQAINFGASQGTYLSLLAGIPSQSRQLTPATIDALKVTTNAITFSSSVSNNGSIVAASAVLTNKSLASPLKVYFMKTGNAPTYNFSSSTFIPSGTYTANVTIVNNNGIATQRTTTITIP